MEEEWKFYKSTWNSRWGKKVYEISNLGRCKVNSEIVDPKKHGAYYRIGSELLHRVVAQLFIPNPENKPYIDHIDTDTSNNRVDNLRWATAKENSNNPETKKHQKKSQKGKKMPEYYKKDLSERMRGEKHWNYGKHLSDEVKNKISKSLTGNKLSTETVHKIVEAHTKNVYVYYKDELIDIVKGVNEFRVNMKKYKLRGKLNQGKQINGYEYTTTKH